MKNPKIGERVRAYFGGVSLVGEIDSVDGDIVKVSDKGITIGRYDRRQCVRLVKKKRREYWIVTSEARAWSVYGSYNDAYECVGVGEDIIHVREVKKK